jgi:DNA-binding XRE family transcriptional regulator
LRRQILLALFRSAKRVLRDLDGLDVFHFDGAFPSTSIDYGKSVSLHQALSVTTEAKAYGLEIRLRRLAFRLTQTQFAKICEIPRTHLSRIEHGHVEIEALTREKIAFGFRLARGLNRNAQNSSARVRVLKKRSVRTGSYQGSSSPSKS